MAHPELAEAQAADEGLGVVHAPELLGGDGVAVLEAGGPGTSPGNAALNQLDRALFEQRLSPGGSADLLAATLFLDALDGITGTVREDNSLNRGTNGTH